ncbi:Rieske domain-containing protein-like isoform X3 [Tubulanus polymorphus]|uniref:Rieske domain-containing protein-like isoform X3 n=1 Tax=Tubulanus polymorphus TaxID=672921 RepID=UPI003DA4C480
MQWIASVIVDTGGPLVDGDIEDINGTTCIVCPWHKYKISLKEGEGFYQAIDPKNLKAPPKWKSKGRKQRVHRCEIESGNLYVTLNKNCENLESDFYSSKEYKERMAKLKK